MGMRMGMGMGMPLLSRREMLRLVSEPLPFPFSFFLYVFPSFWSLEFEKTFSFSNFWRALSPHFLFSFLFFSSVDLFFFAVEFACMLLASFMFNYCIGFFFVCSNLEFFDIYIYIPSLPLLLLSFS